MSAAYIGPGIGNFVGTEFLYENTGGALSQGRLSGLKTRGPRDDQSLRVHVP